MTYNENEIKLVGELIRTIDSSLEREYNEIREGSVSAWTAHNILRASHSAKFWKIRRLLDELMMEMRHANEE